MTRQRGFTLIEMAIVLVIITFLISGLIMPLAAQVQARRIAETKRTLEEAQAAIIGFAMSHSIPAIPGRPYLPCPDINGDGLEDRSGDACTQADGWLPWADLGTASQDAWGNRLHYSVETTEYADRSKGLPDMTLYVPPYTTMNLKRICRSSSCTQVDALYLPVVVFSHGPNGWGALNASGSTLSSPSSADERENTDSDADFVSRPPSKAGDASGEFDDLVIWISDNVLRSRACPAGGCP